ncbi:MAG: Mur ligase family protein [Dokdonella sp.]
MPPVSPPFDDSRRLTGYNLYFADVGAVLETVGVDIDEAVLDGWRARVQRMRAALGWPHGAVVARTHAGGASLALAAPLDQLFTATEVNEWALLSALFSFSLGEPVPAERMRAGHGTNAAAAHSEALPVHPSQSAQERAVSNRASLCFHAPGHAAAWDEAAALHTLLAFARAERQPALVALVDAAQSRGLTVLIDDDTLSFGVGAGSRTWPLASLPTLDAIEWRGLREAPIALVTGSNGKTTTTRLLAALTRAHGWRTAYTCTDGVFVGATALAAGDYSGPAGARVALREHAVDAAILETARGGILRRGIAVQHADVAIVTNVSDDHFGEYGVHDLDDLAAVKLAVARTLGQRGVLVANADDISLVRHAPALKATLAWFAFDADAPLLRAHRERAGTTCGVRGGRLLLHTPAGEHDLGAVAAMPLSFGGSARYNVANIAAAVLAAHALGVAADTQRAVLASFGAARADNPGRLQRWSVAGIDVLVDYAHNPDGLRGLLEVATRLRRGRLGLVLGQAGNREDAEIRELAAAAAQFTPDRIVLKDIAGMLRGRAAGSVPAILHEELVRRGVEATRIAVQLDEFDAVRAALGWARAGDTLVLPVHGTDVKSRVADLLERLINCRWQAGTVLPGDALNPPAPAG